MTKVQRSTIRRLAEAAGIFAKFDTSGDGKLSPGEIRLGIRFFGKYYSPRQTRALLDAYYFSRGSTLALNPEMDLVNFARLLTSFDRFEPLEDRSHPVHAEPPTVVLDFYGRVLYPVLYAGKTLAFLYMLPYYCGSSCVGSGIAL